MLSSSKSRIGLVAVLSLVTAHRSLGSAAALRDADFNGDGFADLAVGVSEEDISGHPAAGAVNVIYGSVSGLTAQGDQLWHQNVSGVLVAAEDEDCFGKALTFGDFDGDGYDDLAVGVRFEDLGDIADAGVVHVLYGSGSGLTAAGNQLWHQDIAGVNGVAGAGDYFGWTMATGDFDQDGFDDLAIGVPNEEVGSIADAGSVNVLYGSANGLTASGDQLWNQNSPGILDQAEEVSPGAGGELFGEALTAGDFDGDGYDDLVVGAPCEELGGAYAHGAANVLFGSGVGLSSSGNQFWNQNSPGVVGSALSGNFFARSLAAGDFDNDGFDDVALGDLNYGWGHVTILYGTASGLTGTGSQLWSQASSGVNGDFDADEFSYALATGDFDGDGFGDLAIGAPQERVSNLPDAGAINVLFGSSNGLNTSGAEYWHQNATGILGIAGMGDHFGAALRSGDYDGDGVSDLAVGVPGEDLGQLHDGTGPFDAIGAVNVMYGSPWGLSAAGDQLWTQHSAGIEDSGEEADCFGLSL